jgi:hypothetical protein
MNSSEITTGKKHQQASAANKKIRTSSQESRIERHNPAKHEYFYETKVPITTEGLLIKIGDLCPHECTIFMGYKDMECILTLTPPYGAFCAIGDQFVQIDGVNVEGKDFESVKQLLLQKSYDGQTHKRLIMRHRNTKPPEKNEITKDRFRWKLLLSDEDESDSSDISQERENPQKEEEVLQSEILASVS